MTTKEAQQLLNTKRKDTSILFHEEYKGDKERHKFRCKKCTFLWESTPNTLKRKDNIGCPNCYEIALQIKKEKKEFSQVRGATKLLNSNTLNIFEIDISIEKTTVIHDLKLQIDQKKKIKEVEEQKIHTLQKDYNLKALDLKNQLSTKTHFGFIFGLILFPIWIWYQLKFEEKIHPYQTIEQEAKKNLDEVIYKIQQLKRDIEHAEWRLNDLSKNLEYEKNLLRLQNRLTLHQGGKTKLYYFRFSYSGKQYYKIGISINGVEDRYRNKDGSLYGRIEKIFFDTYIREAERIEQLILHVFKDQLARDKNLLATKGGYSEVFVLDVLGLDT